MSRAANLRTPAAFALLALLALPLAAQQHPNKEHGFAPEKAYHLGEIDSVNAFNGGLIVTLPIGPSLPLAADLSFGLTLVYNSNLWEWRIPVSPGIGYAEPNPTFNAGIGWRLSLGELVPAHHPSNHTQFVAYVGPDGAHHPFADQVGAFQSPNGPSTPLPAAGSTVVTYTLDGSFLRLTWTPGASPPYRLEHPDGTVDSFDVLGRLVRRENRSGVGLSLAHTEDGWVATDAHGRQVEVIYDHRVGVTLGKVVAEVKVPQFDGTQASYAFEYEDRELPRGCPNDDG
ncbi:MAG TPA: hypothetical protein VF017_02730, partial [Thermoanaerobaculia bacterium]|nr:hypothetical protein [Thermoanaerobaculia bacterium]